MNDPRIQTESIILDRLKVASRQHLSAQLAHDATIETWIEPMTQQLVAQLRTHVYAHKVDRQDVTVPFAKAETFKFAPPRRLLWTYGLVVLLGLALTLATDSLPAFFVTAAVALAWVIVYASNPPREETVKVTGEAVVRREQFNAFPDNGMAYPDTLGAPVHVAMIQDRHARYFDAD